MSMPVLIAQQWVMPFDPVPVVIGGLCVLSVPAAIALVGLVLHLRSGGRAWRPFVLVTAGGVLLIGLPASAIAIYYGQHLQGLLPALLGCLGLACIIQGFRAMLR